MMGVEPIPRFSRERILSPRFWLSFATRCNGNPIFFQNFGSPESIKMPTPNHKVRFGQAKISIPPLKKEQSNRSRAENNFVKWGRRYAWKWPKELRNYATTAALKLRASQMFRQGKPRNLYTMVREGFSNRFRGRKNLINGPAHCALELSNGLPMPRPSFLVKAEGCSDVSYPKSLEGGSS